MKSNYDVLGNHIRLIDTRNTDSVTDRVLGINIDKFFMPSVANVIGTDLRKYKLITKGKFACNPMHVGRDERLPVALYEEDEPAIVSPAYFMFEIIDTDVLDENYLMMWFRRPEFDRICWLHTDGSVRGGITWNDICRLELPVPPIAEQREIIRSYKVIIERIALKKQINDNLEATVQAIFKSLFVDFNGAKYSDFVEFEFGKYPASWNLVDLDSVVDVRDGTHDSPSPTESGKYLITSRHLLPYAVNRGDAYFISESDYKKANERSKVEYGDILFSMIGTIGIISFITEKEIDFAIKNVGLFRTSQNPTIRYFILSYLKSRIVENYIASYMAGSTQSYVSLNVLRKIPLILPTEDVLKHFEKQVTPLYAKMIENTYEITKLNNLKDVITTSMSRRKIPFALYDGVQL